MTEITYAKAHGPPDNWAELEVVDLKTGEVIPKILMVDTEKGLALITAEDGLGRFRYPDGHSVNCTRIEGRFMIRRRVEG